MICYSKRRRVCKFCFYRRRKNNYVSLQDGRYYCPNCGDNCTTVHIMPASRMCENFGNLLEIPIPQVPQWFTKGANRNKPFGVCEKKDHSACYDMSATSDIWFAHSIEELVVWTIEREYGNNYYTHLVMPFIFISGCSFKQYIQEYHSSRIGPPPPRSSRKKNKKKAKQKPLPPPPLHVDLDDFEDEGEYIIESREGKEREERK